MFLLHDSISNAFSIDRLQLSLSELNITFQSVTLRFPSLTVLKVPTFCWAQWKLSQAPGMVVNKSLAMKC